MEIKPITAGDAAAAAVLAGQLGYPSSASELEHRIQEMASSVRDAAFGAFSEGVLIGWIHVFVNYRLESDPFCEIGGLVVDEGSRGLGVGHALIAQAKNWVRQKECTELRVRSNVTRKETHLFYQHEGFSLQKEQKVFRIGC